MALFVALLQKEKHIKIFLPNMKSYYSKKKYFVRDNPIHIHEVNEILLRIPKRPILKWNESECDLVPN